jgi:hypothetical protein
MREYMVDPDDEYRLIKIPRHVVKRKCMTCGHENPHNTAGIGLCAKPDCGCDGPVTDADYYDSRKDEDEWGEPIFVPGRSKMTDPVDVELEVHYSYGPPVPFIEEGGWHQVDHDTWEYGITNAMNMVEGLGGWFQVKP